jgi:hypothetical protein
VQRHFHYESRDEPVMAPKKKFEMKVFITLLDTALVAVKGFEQLHQHGETWCFVYKVCEIPKKEEL